MTCYRSAYIVDVLLPLPGLPLHAVFRSSFFPSSVEFLVHGSRFTGDLRFLPPFSVVAAATAAAVAAAVARSFFLSSNLMRTIAVVCITPHLGTPHRDVGIQY
ncbi:hypothetical protein C8Q70DRAFT_45461 [Cubamyces menziesii]|nr:hypothetical protein C8Q70DRAFT_45461 [Cubamyces menziesii]